MGTLFNFKNKIKLVIHSYTNKIVASLLLSILSITCVLYPAYAAEDLANSACIDSFNQTRKNFQKSNTQSIVILSWGNMFLPFITLQGTGANNAKYSLWQTLNGDIRGYATRNGEGFDFINTLDTTIPLAWHPTFIWDRLFSSDIPLKKFTCVLTGRTRVMGKKVSLLRLIPQEGLRYSYVIAKEDESDFPVELSILDSNGNLASRLTSIDSRVIVGIDFPIHDYVFDSVKEQFSAQELKAKNEKDTSLEPPMLSNKTKLNFNSKSTQEQSVDQSATELAQNQVQEIEASQNSENTNANELANADQNASDNLAPASTENEQKIAEQTQEQLLTEQSVSNKESVSNEKGSSSEQIGSVLANNNTDPLDQKRSNSLKLKSKNKSADNSATSLKVWPELEVPSPYEITEEGFCKNLGAQCLFQEFSDGITSFRVYRNQRSTVYYPVLSNGLLTIVRKNNYRYEFSVVGEIPVGLAEYVLKQINDK